MSHTRTVCPHGVVVSQCRCIKPHKATKVVACPFDHHTGPAWEAQEQVQQLAGAPGTPAPVSLDGPEAHSGAETVGRCPSVMRIWDRAASGEFACTLDPEHAEDHAGWGRTVRWPRLEQAFGEPIVEATRG